MDETECSELTRSPFYQPPPTWNFCLSETTQPDLDTIYFPISLSTLEQKESSVIMKFEDFLFRSQVKPIQYSIVIGMLRNNHYNACIYIPFQSSYIHMPSHLILKLLKDVKPL